MPERRGCAGGAVELFPPAQHQLVRWATLMLRRAPGGPAASDERPAPLAGETRGFDARTQAAAAVLEANLSRRRRSRDTCAVPVPLRVAATGEYRRQNAASPSFLESRQQRA